MLKTYHSLETKPLKEWLLEVRKQSHITREKYERCFRGTKPSIEMMHFWRKTSETYMSLSETLYHLVHYGNYIDNNRCLSCKYEPVHRLKLERDFNRWYPWIIRCQDGDQFKRVKENSIYELMTLPVSRLSSIEPYQQLQL